MKMKLHTLGYTNISKNHQLLLSGSLAKNNKVKQSFGEEFTENLCAWIMEAKL